MDRHHSNVSIAYAVVNIAGGFSHGREGALPSRLSAGILSRAPGDGAQTICREIATAIGMEVFEVRTPQIEYHTGAMSMGVGEPFEEIVARDKPVMVILDEAQSAQLRVLEAIMGILDRRVEKRPCAVLAITSSSGERRVAERMAEGLGVDVDRIAMHRTDEENRRLLRGMLANVEG